MITQEKTSRESSQPPFITIELKREKKGHGWFIVGLQAGIGFRILATIEDPTPYDLVLEFAEKVARSFNVTFNPV